MPSSTPPPAAVPLADATPASLYGSKAAGLAHALRAGLNVPAGVALAHPFVDAVAHQDPAALRDLAAVWQPAWAVMAVRSSAVGEDSAEHSFAGQHLTVLGVRTPDALASAVTRVWESGHAAGPSAYRARRGVTDPVQMAVVVQAIVDAEVAGVLFTRNPATGADERVIEATWGLGEALVSGMVTPDNYRVARGGVLLARRVGDKDLAVALDPRGGTRELPMDRERAGRPCLDPARLRELDALATRCEALFGVAQDLEWAYADARLYLLQSRAVTAGAR